MRAESIARDTAVGAAAGLAASAAMSLFQAGWSALQEKLAPDEQDDGTNGDQPSTVKAADRAARAATDRPVPAEDKGLAGEAVHYGFGALLGAVYGGAASALPKVRTGFGLPFATAVWALADEAAVPAASLSPPPTKTPASQHFYSLASHLVFGAALEGSRRGIEAGLRTVFGSERQH